MILRSFKIVLGLLLFSFSATILNSEEKIDIWKNKNKTIKELESPKKSDDINLEKTLIVQPKTDIKIEENVGVSDDEVKVFGIYDPADNNFNLNMWSTTKAEDVRASLKRIKKIKLSKTSNEILENVLLSFSYPPQGMDEKEFVNLKIEWLIKNNRLDLIENFLIQNKEFDGKSKAVQFLVDSNISQANIKEGCEKVKFIDSTIKDSYLEKFKIYCLVFNKKNSQAQLLLDLLREQNQSDQFFDDKINYLLGITSKTSTKINEKNLLNFYLSSVTIENFDYTPSNKTKQEIWKYLNAANLIKLEDLNDKQKIKELEVAANVGQIDTKLIFDIYRQIPFNLNTLINAKNIYQTLDDIEARSLIYQKYLLSEEISSKLDYLFLLEELFKSNKIQNIFTKELVKNLNMIGIENIPDNYKEIVEKRINTEQSVNFGKVKYNDKILHQSKIIKLYVEKEDVKKIQKDIDKIFKKISKNRKYFYSAKDLALVDALLKMVLKLDNLIKRHSNK